MAVNGLAGFHGSAVHPTRVLRNLAATLLAQPPLSHANAASATTRGGCYGVASGGDLAVTGTGALNISIAAGRLAGPGTTALAQGAYVGYNDAAVASAVGARNATNPRIDYVAWRVRDTDEDATGAEDDGLIVIAGTAAASPVPPTLSAGQGTLVILAEILVPSTANGGPIAITDRRTYLTAVGGVQRCTSTTRPTSLAVWAGLFITELDTGRVYRRNNGNTAWTLVHGRCNSVYSASGAVAAGFANLTWGTEIEDTDAFGSVPSATITIPAGFGGKYELTASTVWAVAATGINWLTFVINGVSAGGSQIAVGHQQTLISRSASLAAGDTVTVQYGNGAGGAATVTAFLEVVYMGP